MQPMPGQPQPQPQPPYGYPTQPPVYGAGQQQPYPPYGQPPAQPWGQQQLQRPAYGSNPQYAGASQPTKKSSALGITGFAVVVLSLLVGIGLAIASSPAFVSLMSIIPPGATTQAEIQQVWAQLPQAQQDAIARQLGGPLAGIGVASLVGLIGWVISIVATATARGRGWGIAGIIVGVLAPVAIFFALSIAAGMAVAAA